jgi:cytochrome c551/c552
MKVRNAFSCVVLSVAMFTPAFAADSTAVFVQKCGVCHKKGADATPVNPADKAGVVWAKYFERGRHPVDLASQINDGDMELILGFLQDHAADSDQPVAAAIPK